MAMYAQRAPPIDTVGIAMGSPRYVFHRAFFLGAHPQPTFKRSLAKSYSSSLLIPPSSPPER